MTTITIGDYLLLRLKQIGIKENDPVCVYQDPTVDWLCSMLAIWKLNAVYVPLELRNPISRLRKMVADCQPARYLQGPVPLWEGV